jgi:hypothetical protein
MSGESVCVLFLFLRDEVLLVVGELSHLLAENNNQSYNNQLHSQSA